MKPGRAAAALALLALAVPAWAAKAIPPSPRSYIYNEGVVSPGAEEAVSLELAGVERQTGRQFVVALFQSLDGESLEDYTNKVFRAWKIGSKKADDGLLFALYLQEHRWRIEVGYGLESTITDLEASELVQGVAVPSFKAGDYDGGVRAAVEALSARLRGVAAPRGAPSGAAPVTHDALVFWLIFVVFVFLFLSPFFALTSGVVNLGRRSRWGGGGWGGGGWGGGSDWGGGGWGGGGGGFGGFSGGGGSSGGGGASGGW